MNRESLQFILRQIYRAPIKSVFMVITALIIVIALSVLQGVINDYEREIDRLYNTTVVTGYVYRADPMGINILTHWMRNDILRTTVDNLTTQDFIRSTYAEASYPWFFIIPSDENGNFPIGIEKDFWDEFFEEIIVYYNMLHDRDDGWIARVDPLFSFNDFDAFIREFELRPDVAPGGIRVTDLEELWPDMVVPLLEIHFKPGFDKHDFVYSDATLQSPVPVILSEYTLAQRGLSVGETAFIGRPFIEEPPFHRSRGQRHEHYPIIIIGSHNSGIDRQMARNATLLPLYALELIRGNDLGYVTLRFEIDTAANRGITAIREEITRIARNSQQNHFMQMNVFIHDEELRVVVGQMENTLTLFQRLYPIAIAFSVVVGTGLSVLITLQNAKIAAIMRVLGTTKIRVRMILFAKNTILSLIGILLGLSFILVISIDSMAEIIIFAFIYLIGTGLGSFVGAVLVSKRAPLDLLQIKE
jgi:hypothetical protein